MKKIHVPSLPEERLASPKGKYRSFVKNISLALDFLIILMTTKTILRGSGAR